MHSLEVDDVYPMGLDEEKEQHGAEPSAGSKKAHPKASNGAHFRDRTGDLSLTKTVLYLLS